MKGRPVEIEKERVLVIGPLREIIPDIGNFLMLLFFSNRDTHTEKMKKIWYALFEDSSARRPNWIFHQGELKEQIQRSMRMIYTLDYLKIELFC